MYSVSNMNINHLLIVLLTLLHFQTSNLFKQKKFQKQDNCEENTTQLINLFTLVCNNIASENVDFDQNACVGCFTIASRSNNNQPSLSDLNNCANTYFVDTRYDGCVSSLNSASQTYTGQCVSGYCMFVTCLRRINSDLLIAQCYFVVTLENPGITEIEQITLYKNVTSCILAMARCSSINPITGQPQTNLIPVTSYNKWGKPVTTNVPIYNSLQINRAGDLRIVAFRGTTNLQPYFCSNEYNLIDSTWLNYTC